MTLTRTYLLLSFFLIIGRVQAAKVDTVDTYSASMKKTIRAVVITPDAYTNGGEFPVVYLLHGYGGNYSDWVGEKSAGAAQGRRCQRSRYGLPDGSMVSWYFDGPI